MQIYLNLLRKVLQEGTIRNDRTNTGTRSIFGAQMRFDLTKGFPLITTKKIYLRSIIYELLWFLRGETNIHYLNDNGVHIWDDWANKNGDLGPVYGAQWRSWPTGNGEDSIDQIAQVIYAIRHEPTSRRLIVCSWNVSEISRMVLPPCHCLFQFYVANGALSCQLYQRSADIFLGVPFNIASYALLTMMIAQICELTPGEFVHTLGDAHLYCNHVEQAEKQITRAPFSLPQLILNSEIKRIQDFCFEDFVIKNYQHHPHIKAAIAV